VSRARILVCLGATALLATPLAAKEAPGWYLLHLATGGEPLTVKLVSDEKDFYLMSFEGSILRVEKSTVRKLERISLPEDEKAAQVKRKVTDGKAGSAAPGPKAAAGPGGAGPSETAIRDAIEMLASSDAAAFGKAYGFLAKEFPVARAQLHRALGHGKGRVRMMAAKLLGEKGSAKKDLEAVSGRLTDENAQVRRAAVEAVRALGSKGLASLVRYLETETDSSNRKAAVQTMKIWNDPGAVAPLVNLLARDRDSGVKHFAVLALESLTGQNFGKDLSAWQAYLGKKSSANG